ncbi:MAG: transposase [Ideonella sp.]|nr:transposase [Ideonella sp.]
MSKQDTQAKRARRRHAEAFRRDLVERSLQPGASVSGIALENGVNTNMLFRWRREHLRAAKGRHDHGAARAVLLPVKVAPAAAVASDWPSVPANVPVPAGVIGSTSAAHACGCAVRSMKPTCAARCRR